MLLLITSPEQESFTLEVDEFVGFEVYEAVQAQWGDDWDTYTVTQGDQVIESVINARTLR
jgi:hypothetical protein